MILARALLTALVGVFNYGGRSDRLEHWAFSFLSVSFGFIIWARVSQGDLPSRPVLWLIVIGVTWFTLAHIALFVRRLHDHGRSGAWLLLPLPGLFVALTAWMDLADLSSLLAFLPDQKVSWIMTGGMAFASSMAAGALLPVFFSKGDEKENRFGDPVE